jgi:hypothetical protein
MDLTNLQALLNDQKAGSGSELTSHQLAFKLPSTRHSCLTDGLGAQRVARFYPVGLTASNLALLRLLPAKVFPQAMGLAAISMRLRPVRLAA